MQNKPKNNCNNQKGLQTPKPVSCPICGRKMRLLECFIPREEMHFAYHAEACSEWECVCGYNAFIGLSSKKFYPYKKIILK